MINLKQPKPPCNGCEERTSNCHNESCPYGWAEYEAAHEAYLQSLGAVKERNRTVATKAKKAFVRRKKNEMGWKK